MRWFSAPEYWLARLVFGRVLGLVYLVAFVSVLNQFPALIGEHGLLPARRYLDLAGPRRTPSLFHLHFSDRFAKGCAWTGIGLSVAVVVGAVERAPLWATMLAWAVLWALYLSFVNAGQIFFGFVWETLTLEAGFLALFLGNARTSPPVVVVFAIRWLLFRLEVGAGLIKIRHDPAWRDLSALYYHYETQPLPNRLSWWFHHLPAPVHKLEVAGNHTAQLLVPIALFLPQPIASVAGCVVVITQLWLMLSGNFAWLNLLALNLAVMAFDDRVLQPLVPVHPPALAGPPVWFEILVLAFAAAMVVLSYWPVRNMASRSQLMNASYNPLHVGNTYGLFGSITRERAEVIIEGTVEEHLGPETLWEPYEFKAKPGDVTRRPRQVAPYHLRLDWLMWFAALSPRYAEGWFVPLVMKLLDNDPATLRLLGTNPFPDRPPTFIRALLYSYRFSNRRERKRSGAWWRRQLVGQYLPPLSLRSAANAPG